MILLVAIGNQMRHDDGAGHRVLELLEPIAGVTRLACHQLTPELSQDVAAADTAVFIDADVERGAPRLETAYAAGPSGAAATHFSSASELVALARALYSFQGEALLCRVPGEDFSYGFGLSAYAEANAQAAARLLGEVVVR